MKKIKVFLAGIGGYGMNYCREFLSAPSNDFELVGVADPFAQSSPAYEEIKARSIPVYQSPTEFFAEKRADLSIISSPIHTHYPYIKTCFENGSHVLCEKPVTGDINELDELIALEKKTGLFAAVGFQLSFSRDVHALKQDILDGLFGKPLELKTVRLNCRTTTYYRRNRWAGALNFEGRRILDSPLQNANSHELHNMLFLLGRDMRSAAPVDTLSAELWKGRQDIENYDAAAVRIKTAGGVPVLFYTAHCVQEKMGEPLGEFRFEKAVVRWETAPAPGFTAYFNDGRKKSYKEVDKGQELKKLYDSLAAIQSGEPPVCTLETVRPHASCVELIQQFPIRNLSGENVVQCTTDDNDTFFYVPGLYQNFIRAYEQSALPSEIGFNL